VNELIEEIETLKAIIAGLQQQLLRVGNQQDVLKAAYLAGQMAKPVKTFSGNKPNYVIPQETFDAATVAEAEREACAKIVLDNSDAEGICCTDDVLEALRQRGEKNGG